MRVDALPLVLHVIHHLVIGGMENGLVNLINNMPASRYRHAIACIEDYSDFRLRIAQPNVEVVALRRSRIGVWRLRREIFHLCRHLRPAVIHSRGQSGLDALLPARLAGVEHCVHGEHGWDMNNLAGRNWRPAVLRRLHAPLVDRYITVSKDLQRYLIEQVGIGPGRISQIYNGVDTERFAPAPLKWHPNLPEGFQGADLIRIGTVGRIQPVKDQATLLHAFAQLRASRPDLRDRLRLAIVGDGPLLGELRSLADSLNIGACTWLPGALGDIPDALRAMDVFVLPSLNEGISNTVLEAMACGLPVVATRVGGNPELIEEGTCGRFFEPHDAADLAQLLGEYANDRNLCRAHGQAARRRAVERFSLATMVAAYGSVYDALCVQEVAAA